MPKRSLSEPRAKPRVTRGAARPDRTPEEPPRGAPARSDLAQLVAEVERLESELAEARARLADVEARADIDPLTDIFNRRGFERELERALSYVKRYRVQAALIYLDLDRFKPVNDRYGHAAGDAVLKAVATALVANVRASDTVARLGGDEFAVILWNLAEAQAQVKAHALEGIIGDMTVCWGPESLAVGASAGVAMLAPSASCAEVLEKADRGMYARKGVLTRARRRGQ